MYRQLLPQLLRKIALTATAIGAAVILVIGLTGCGNKGDLYLPEDTAKTFSSAADSATNTLIDQSEL